MSDRFGLRVVASRNPGRVIHIAARVSVGIKPSRPAPPELRKIRTPPPGWEGILPIAHQQNAVPITHRIGRQVWSTSRSHRWSAKRQPTHTGQPWSSVRLMARNWSSLNPVCTSHGLSQWSCKPSARGGFGPGQSFGARGVGWNELGRIRHLCFRAYPMRGEALPQVGKEAAVARASATPFLVSRPIQELHTRSARRARAPEPKQTPTRRSR